MVRDEVVAAISPEVRRVAQIGRKHRWEFHIIGRAELPTRPTFHRGWWLVPAQQDSGRIPARAYERVQALYDAGVRPKGFIIAHEAPPLLAASEQVKAPHKPLIDWDQGWRFLSSRVIGPLMSVGTWAALVPALLTVLKALAIGLGALIAVPGILILGLGALALVDPVLVAVTEDDYWVEIDRWWS